MKDHKYDIERYLSGGMTPAEMHALEREALSDPFLADALEGAEIISPEEFVDDVQALKSGSARRTKPTPAWSWPLRIAAVLVVLVVASFFVVWKVGNPLYENRDLALEQKTQAKEKVSPAKQVNTKAIPSPAAPATPAPANSTEAAGETKQDEASVATNQNAGAEENTKAAEKSGQPTLIASQKKTDTSGSTPALGEGVAQKQATSLSGESSARMADIAADSGAVVHTIRGKVTSGGADIVGATISTKTGNSHAVSDGAGNYEITVTDANPALVFSSDGYKSKEIDPGQATVVNADLDSDLRASSEHAIEPSTDQMQAKMQLPSAHAQSSIGKDDFDKYLASHVQYPSAALANQVEGRVTVEFTVDATGALKDFKVIKGIGSGCDEELIRLIRTGPPWTPAQLGGHAVDEQVRVKFKFELPR